MRSRVSQEQDQWANMRGKARPGSPVMALGLLSFSCSLLLHLHLQCASPSRTNTMNLTHSPHVAESHESLSKKRLQGPHLGACDHWELGMARIKLWFTMSSLTAAGYWFPLSGASTNWTAVQQVRGRQRSLGQWGAWRILIWTLSKQHFVISHYPKERVRVCNRNG